MENICITAAIKPVLSNAPMGVEILKRVNGNSSWLFVLNHSSAKVSVSLETDGSDLLTGMEVSGSIELEPSGVAIIQNNRLSKL
jgi:beta-galactosidase